MVIVTSKNGNAGGRGGRRGGFTLLELIIVIAVIGILAAVAMPRLAQVPITAKEAVLKTNLKTMRDVINQFYADKGSYPPTLEALVEEDYLRDVPKDPMTKSNETWVTVFEDPDAEEIYDDAFDYIDEAEPGIIDVFSGSPDLGLDGTPYAEW